MISICGVCLAMWLFPSLLLCLALIMESADYDAGDDDD